MSAPSVILLLNQATTVAAQTRSCIQLPVTFSFVEPMQCEANIRIVAAAAWTCTIVIEGSANDSAFSTVATYTLSGTGNFNNASVLVIPFPWVRANVTVITGSATADLILKVYSNNS